MGKLLEDAKDLERKRGEEMEADKQRRREAGKSLVNTRFLSAASEVWLSFCCRNRQKGRRERIVN